MSTIPDIQNEVQETFNVQGFMCKDPTDLSLPFPHGGDSLGLFGQVVWKITPTRAELTAQEYANQTYELIEGAENIVVAATLRTFNAEALETIFPALVSGGPLRTFTTQRGALGSGRAVKLLISPLSSEDQPALLVYRAVPLIADAVNVSHNLNKEWGIATLWLGLPDATGRLYHDNPLSKLSL